MNRLGIFHFFFYSAVSILYVYSFCIYDANLYRENKYAKLGFPFDSSFGGRAKFLTYINVCIQIALFSLSALNAFKSIVSADQSDTITGVTNFLYTSLAFPVGTLVSISFWSLYFIDRSLVFPTALDSIVPSWLNHVLHTLPVTSLLIESFISQHKYIPGRIFWTCSSILIYIFWTLYIAFVSDQWVYGILKVLTPFNRTLFIASQTLFAMFLFKVGEYLNQQFWAKSKTN